VNIGAIPRTAIDGYLRLVRFPLAGAISLLPGNGTGAKPTAEVALDRADATVRGVIATVLSDPALREDAQRRRTAAQERGRALRLRSQAEVKAETADSRLEQRQRQATEQREQASRRAAVREQMADRELETKKRRAAKDESDRRQASRRTAERADQALGAKASKERLETVDAKADALKDKEKELAVRDEARRLREAASRVKSERKAD
jgi:hypothetical protein